MCRFRWLVTASFLLTLGASSVRAEVGFYATRVVRMAEPLCERLAESARPSVDGAMGRNRPAYIHARFQLGCHRLADYAVVAKDKRALEMFLRAVEYAFAHQTDDGGFSFVAPRELRGKGQPSVANLASGTAFFTASAGAGMRLLRSSEWFVASDELAETRRRLSALERKSDRVIDYLVMHRDDLLRVDRLAPNRLLYDALALITLGQICERHDATELGDEFLRRAIAQVHADGYFIEGGGYDSSYNGVATSLAYRIGLVAQRDDILQIADRGLAWQLSRVAETGEICVDGNTRVNEDGEAFLGRKKDVDVGCTLESLALSSAIRDDEKLLAVAERILKFYRSRR